MGRKPNHTVDLSGSNTIHHRAPSPPGRPISAGGSSGRTLPRLSGLPGPCRQSPDQFRHRHPQCPTECDHLIGQGSRRPQVRWSSLTGNPDRSASSSSGRRSTPCVASKIRPVRLIVSPADALAPGEAFGESKPSLGWRSRSMWCPRYLRGRQIEPCTSSVPVFFKISDECFGVSGCNATRCRESTDPRGIGNPSKDVAR